MRAEDERAFAAVALREQGAEDTGEHIAHAGARHAGIAGPVHEPVPVARREDAAIALKDHLRIEILAQHARRLHAIGLHRGGIRAEQPPGLGGMRR